MSGGEVGQDRLEHVRGFRLQRIVRMELESEHFGVREEAQQHKRHKMKETMKKLL